jgi:GTPase involved in cell partitioning and DNA repair
MADGGDGASGDSPLPEKGDNANGKAGGGGGALGRIRLNVRAGLANALDIKSTAVLSPDLDDANSTATTGSAATAP